MKKLFFCLFFVIHTLLFCACGTTVSPTLKLSDEQILMLESATGTITLITDSDETIVWESSNDTVVSVSANVQDDKYGMLKAKQAGTAVITARQGNQTLRCSVRIVELQLLCENGSSITLDLKDGYAQEKLLIKTNVEDGKSISYRSDNLLVAKVLGDGTIVAVDCGSTKIKVVHPSGLSFVVNVEVVNSAKK